MPLDHPAKIPVLWSNLTWEEIPSRLASVGGSAILPIGATEQHGPHLGCGMDTVLAARLCRDASASSGVPVLPALSYGCSLGHSQRWPGTISLDPLVMAQLVNQVGTWAYASGVRRLFLVNAHVTNAAPVRCALEMLRSTHDDLMVAHVDTAKLSERVQSAHFSDAEDWHANEAETALMMALDPAMVRPDKLSTGDDEDRTSRTVFAHPVNRTSLNGTTGRPSTATKERGEELYGWMVEDLVSLIRRGMAEQPPLPFSYGSRVAADLTLGANL